MGSNLSRQSERKDEKREDFAVYDAQNYRKICEKYMSEANEREIRRSRKTFERKKNFKYRRPQTVDEIAEQVNVAAIIKIKQIDVAKAKRRNSWEFAHRASLLMCKP